MEKQEKQNLLDRIAILEDEVKGSTGEIAALELKLKVVAALEKVRNRAINMRSSSELSETSSLLFHQLNELNIRTTRTSVGIFDDTHDAMELWVTAASGEQEVLQVLDYFSLHIHPVFEAISSDRKQNKPFSLIVLRGNQVKDYYETMSTYITRAEGQADQQEDYFYSFFFGQGALMVNVNSALTELQCGIMIQFAQAFGLIYMRFLDLQTAETQKREALQQRSLDRVRAEVASMRTAHDLQHITPLIWQVLVNLGVEFVRCGIFIVDESEKIVHAYLSTPQGKSIGVLHLPFDGLNTTMKIVEHWKEIKVYKDIWERKEFESWVKSMLREGEIVETHEFQSVDTPFETLYLQFTPFTQGMLYIGSLEYLSFDELELIRSLTESLSIAYARYYDFIKLEEAKNKIENALHELKSTQSQLIQSEKMASLGELTAGIAHEIQNPLNFVNNFSEINKELTDELEQEVDKGNITEVKVLAKDIKENQEKILHHGKRADAIVKGMLQHSRSSSGVKEPTDINALADEYLRLAYHGLRAKDKSFNATMKIDFDESIGMINAVPQDLGRVILNLITNAFYAVTEKKKLKSEGFEPTVTVSTKRLSPAGGGKGVVEISVKDNGNGIPESIKDKIFQPFFTTKPTGQGTGLGLSMSYDIIKNAHQGDIKVQSKEGEGTEFIVVLPII